MHYVSDDAQLIFHVRTQKLTHCRNFGPSLAPLLQVAWRGIVEVDASFQAPLISLEDYKTTCSFASWETVMHYAKTLRKHKTKIAFFSSTPQGGGVALMRHALVRFSRVMGVDLRWYGKLPCRQTTLSCMFRSELMHNSA
jgi:hypothetical protein